ncbi:uncharacterized protein LOC129250061 [Anastrepha obliqua]|uniref:uncharacterized protein LOC129250061 n=1 Tax=Anastrepha obliqua TaxID=95512 RepID=UPI0024098A2B|nr:uncharacterized protein LOC129250061 [Anastrepha obliqua]
MAGVGNLELFDLNQPMVNVYGASKGSIPHIFRSVTLRPLAVTNHFLPRSSEIAAYYHFHKRDQYPDESVSNYIAALRPLAVDCNFGAALDRMLRDRFVCGMKDEGLQKSLLAGKDLTVQKVIERALSNEAAAISAMAMRPPSEPVYAVNENRFRPRTKNAINSNQQLSCNGCGRSHPRSMRKKSYRQENVNKITPLVNQKRSISATINGSTCIFEVDSGSPVTIMTESTFNSVWSNRKPDLSKCDLDLSDYQHNHIPVKGIIDMSIYHNRRKIKNLPLIIASSGGSNLFGCNCFDALGKRIEGDFGINSGFSIKAILKKHDHLFSTDFGRYTGLPVPLQIDSAVPPVRLPPRRIPFATVSTLLASIEGGSIYAKIDLTQAYQQLVVDGRSSLLQTVSMHKDAFKVTRRQFGISSAPGIFQSCIENILQSIPGVLPYFDDIVVMGKSEDELANRLEQIFVRFDKAGLRSRKDKCQFSMPSIELLGFKLDNLGIRPSPAKIKATHEAPSPKNKKQLQAFLSLLNFYHAFLPNKATIAEPLHRLLDKSALWTMKEQHKIVFNTRKRLIASKNGLIH